MYRKAVLDVEAVLAAHGVDELDASRREEVLLPRLNRFVAANEDGTKEVLKKSACEVALHSILHYTLYHYNPASEIKCIAKRFLT